EEGPIALCPRPSHGLKAMGGVGSSQDDTESGALTFHPLDDAQAGKALRLQWSGPGGSERRGGSWSRTGELGEQVRQGLSAQGHPRTQPRSPRPRCSCGKGKHGAFPQRQCSAWLELTTDCPLLPPLQSLSWWAAWTPAPLHMDSVVLGSAELGLTGLWGRSQEVHVPGPALMHRVTTTARLPAPSCTWPSMPSSQGAGQWQVGLRGEREARVPCSPIPRISAKRDLRGGTWEWLVPVPTLQWESWPR
ncbi:hypothetical protein H8958_002816, partial [Nasalis larvatus]